MRQILIATALLLTLTATGTSASQAPAAERLHLQIESRILGELREIDVALPPTWRQSDRAFPVMLVLDGESLFELATGVSSYMASLREMPEVIVIGVRNTARTRDLTPPALDGFQSPIPESEHPGGAEAFARFLSEELRPELRDRYRAADFSILVGHSLGGLFGAWAAAANPDAFGAVLTLDPSLWWNDRAVVSELVDALRNRDTGVPLRIASIEAVGGFRSDWDAILTASTSDILPFQYLIESGESHQSMPLIGLREGLRGLFSDFPPPEPVAGVDPVTQIEAHYNGLTERLGFSVEMPPALLAQAAMQALDAGNPESATRAAERLRASGNPSQARLIESRVAELAALDEVGDDRLIPLIFPEERPSLTEMGPWLGRWEGRMDNEPGVDFDYTLELVASGDTVEVRTSQTGPGGQTLNGKGQLIRGIPGGFEFGVPLRGVPGLEVHVMRLGEDGWLTGSMEVRGFRIPEGATVPQSTLRVRPTSRSR